MTETVIESRPCKEERPKGESALSVVGLSGGLYGGLVQQHQGRVQCCVA